MCYPSLIWYLYLQNISEADPVSFLPSQAQQPSCWFTPQSPLTPLLLCLPGWPHPSILSDQSDHVTPLGKILQWLARSKGKPRSLQGPISWGSHQRCPASSLTSLQAHSAPPMLVSLSHLRAMALTGPSTWNVLPLEIHYPLSSFEYLFKCYLLTEASLRSLFKIPASLSPVFPVSSLFPLTFVTI